MSSPTLSPPPSPSPWMDPPSDPPVRRTSRTRSVWVIGGSILTALALIFGALQAASALATDTRTTDKSFDAGEINAIEISVDNGAVVIDGREGADQIRVQSRIREGLTSTDFSLRVTNGRLVIRGECGWLSEWCESRVNVIAPPNVPVVVTSDNDDITVRRMRGGVDLSTENGDIEVGRLSQRVRLRSENGDITGTQLAVSTLRAGTENGTVSLVFSTPPGRVDATSENGDVELVLPDTPEAYRLSTNADNGAVDDSIRTDPSSNRTINMSSGNGDLTVRYPS